MAVNDTKDWYYLTPEGTVYVGDSPPSGSTVLVAPGGPIDDALAERHGIADRLGKPTLPRDGAGNPIVVRAGRAIAADVLPDGDPDRKAVLEAARKEDEVKREEDEAAKAKVAAHDAKAAKAGGGAESKAVHADSPGVEDKALKGPAAEHRPIRKGK